MSVTTYSKEERKAQALKIGLKMAKKEGVKRVGVNAIAREMEVSGPLLFHVFGNRAGLHKAIIKAAKDSGVTLPESAPTVREARAVKKTTAAKTTTKLKKGSKPTIKMPKVPVKKAAAKKAPAAPKMPPVPVKKVAVKKAAAKKAAAKKVPAAPKMPSVPAPVAAPAPAAA